jgi:hypothetical protein
MEQIQQIAHELGKPIDICDGMKVLELWEATDPKPHNLTLWIKELLTEEKLEQAINQMGKNELQTLENKLDKSRELLAKAYKLFLKKQELIKRINEETRVITEEMEACIHFAFEELPINYDPEDWLLIDKDIICKWVNPEDVTHVVEFQIIH